MEPPQNAGPIIPQPVPTGMAIGQVRMPDGSNAALVTVTTPVGVAHYFLPLETARQIGVALKKVADAGHLTLVQPRG